MVKTKMVVASFYFYLSQYVSRVLPIVVTDRFIKEIWLSEMRGFLIPRLTYPDSGWHCSYFSSFPDIVRKLVSFMHVVRLSIPFYA